MAQNSKAAKKLKDFNKEKEKISKRFKSLISYLDASNEQGQKQFFNTKYEQIFAVFRGRFMECETSAKKDRKQHAKDISSLILLLKKFMVFLPNLIKKRWQFATIARFIAACMDPENQQHIRVQALELLLIFIQILQTSMDEQISLFAASFVYKPFEVNGPKRIKKELSRKSMKMMAANSKALCPSAKEITEEMTLELMQTFFDFISKGEHFPFWLDIWKGKVYSVLYMSSAVELGIIKKPQDKRFASHCPYPLQNLILEQLKTWIDMPEKCTYLWRRDNVGILHAICKQACQAPISQSRLTRLAMGIFRSCIMVKPPLPKTIDDALLQESFVTFMQNLSLVFFTASSGNEEIVTHSGLCKDVLAYYLVFAIELGEVINSATWKSLQNTILKFSHDLFTSMSPFTLDNIVTTVAEDIVKTLFIIWIRSTITTPQMWGDLSSKLSKVVSWGAVVEQWRRKVIQLTYLVREFIYPDGDKKEISGVQKETRLTRNIKWDNKRIFNMWLTILRILGNPCAIEDAANFTLAMNAISEVAELIRNENNKFYDKDLNAKPPINVKKLVLPWLLEACGVEEKRNRGRLLALSSCAQFFCTPFSKRPEPNLLAHFYRVLQNGLRSSHSSIVWVIIRNFTNLLSIGLPGVGVLIPDILDQLTKLWQSNHKTPLPNDVQEKSLTMIISMICYPRQFPTVQLGGKSMVQILKQIGCVLMVALNHKDIKVKNKQKCLWGIYLFMYQELNSKLHMQLKDLLLDCMKGILVCITSYRSVEVSITALECLNNLCSMEKLEIIASFDPNILNDVVSALTEDIITGITECKEDSTKSSSNAAPASVSSPREDNEPARFDSREAIVSNHYYVLLKLVLLIGQSKQLILKPDGIQKVYRALEWGILGEDVEPQKSTKGGKKGNMADSKNYENLFNLLKKNPSHGSEEIRDSAEIFLLTLMNHFGNFPSSIGGTQISCNTLSEALGAKVDTTPKDDEFYFLYNSISVFGFKELDAGNGEKFVRLTLRDCTGKYVWDFGLTYDLYGDQGDAFSRIQIPKQAAGKASGAVLKLVKSKKAQTKLAVGNNDAMLDLLHKYKTDVKSRARMNTRVPVDAPLTPHQDYAKDLKVFSDAINAQQVHEGKAGTEGDASRNAMTFPKIYPTLVTDPGNFHTVRLLLSHLGFFDQANRKRMDYIVDSERFRRSIKELDKVNGREVAKVGLIYVTNGQTHQRKILRNDYKVVSRDYLDFADSLGYSVDLATHRGFMGKLDRKGVAGTVAPYWSDAMSEVIFHDITKMPTVESDEQQIAKKRHVGNDVVHVVWTENRRKYDAANTITSHFNDVHLIVYPLENGLYRIEVAKKAKVRDFGPVQDGMVLNKQNVGPLIRMTAMNANFAVRRSTKGYRRPYQIRAKMIQDVHSRYTSGSSFNVFMEKLFLHTSTATASKKKKKPSKKKKFETVV